MRRSEIRIYHFTYLPIYVFTDIPVSVKLDLPLYVCLNWHFPVQSQRYLNALMQMVKGKIRVYLRRLE